MIAIINLKIFDSTGNVESKISIKNTPKGCCNPHLGEAAVDG
jgi:hypothetical protein